MPLFESFSAIDGLGVLGFLIYATADTMLALRKLNSEQILFYLLYALGAVMILTSLLWNFNIGAFMSEVFALLTCALAICLRLRTRRAKTA